MCELHCIIIIYILLKNYCRTTHSTWKSVYNGYWADVQHIQKVANLFNWDHLSLVLKAAPTMSTRILDNITYWSNYTKWMLLVIVVASQDRYIQVEDCSIWCKKPSLHWNWLWWEDLQDRIYSTVYKKCGWKGNFVCHSPIYGRVHCSCEAISQTKLGNNQPNILETVLKYFTITSYSIIEIG